jgi:hypothetical protein
MKEFPPPEDKSTQLRSTQPNTKPISCLSYRYPLTSAYPTDCQGLGVSGIWAGLRFPFFLLEYFRIILAQRRLSNTGTIRRDLECQRLWFWSLGPILLEIPEGLVWSGLVFTERGNRHSSGGANPKNSRDLQCKADSNGNHSRNIYLKLILQPFEIEKRKERNDIRFPHPSILGGSIASSSIMNE